MKGEEKGMSVSPFIRRIEIGGLLVNSLIMEVSG